MTVGAGWIGSGAVGETGQRWMSAAGPAIQFGVPFWMSGLVGRSRTTSFQITGAAKAAGSYTYIGFSQSNGQGGVGGNYFGRQILGLYSRIQTGNQTIPTIFVLSGAMSGSVSLVLFGVRYQFNYDGSYGGYTCLDYNLGNSMFNQFFKSPNSTITVTT